MNLEDLPKLPDEQIVKLARESNLHTPEEAGAKTRAVATVEMLRRVKEAIESHQKGMETLTEKSDKLSRILTIVSWIIPLATLFIAIVSYLAIR